MALAKLIPVIHESREQVMGFQTSISRVPALTGRFKRSRRRAAAILGELVAEMSFSIQEVTALLEEMGGDPAEPTEAPNGVGDLIASCRLVESLTAAVWWSGTQWLQRSPRILASASFPDKLRTSQDPARYARRHRTDLRAHPSIQWASKSHSIPIWRLGTGTATFSIVTISVFSSTCCSARVPRRSRLC